jgi:hypothetical protein
MTALQTAWDELHAVTPPGWFAGRPGQRHGGPEQVELGGFCTSAPVTSYLSRLAEMVRA